MTNVWLCLKVYETPWTRFNLVGATVCKGYASGKNHWLPGVLVYAGLGEGSLGEYRLAWSDF